MARLDQRRTSAVPSFTSKYGVGKLVYFEIYDDMYTAISREKQLKAWRRAWKIALIEEDNPDWADLYLPMMSNGPLHPDIAAALASL